MVWKGFNDDEQSIKALVAYCKKVPSKVNLIEYNAIGDARFQQADAEVLELYRQELSHAGISSFIGIAEVAILMRPADSSPTKAPNKKSRC